MFFCLQSSIPSFIPFLSLHIALPNLSTLLSKGKKKREKNLKGAENRFLKEGDNDEKLHIFSSPATEKAEN